MSRKFVFREQHASTHRILIVEDDILPIDLLPRASREWQNTQIIRTASVLVGAFHARQQRFDLAIIDATLPRWCGFLIAEFAASNGTPTLLLCWSAGNGHLQSCGYPHLSQPFSLDELRFAARHEIARGEANIAQVKGATAKLADSNQSLAELIEGARRLIGG